MNFDSIEGLTQEDVNQLYIDIVERNGDNTIAGWGWQVICSGNGVTYYSPFAEGVFQDSFFRSTRGGCSYENACCAASRCPSYGSNYGTVCQVQISN